MAISKKQFKKDSIFSILFIVMITAGVCCLLYPPTADVINTLNETKVIRIYKKDVCDLPTNIYEQAYKQALDYNKQLAELNYPLLEANKIEGYERTLDFSGNGVMGIVDIPKINVSLPIYHGTKEAVLGTSVGHLQGTSLPIGGENTHAVIAAHRGATNARLFTDIDTLEIGDEFTITTLGKVLTYRVNNIATVLPEETELLDIIPNKDYVTLQTCTPYGINSHRLLVRGEHILTTDATVNSDGKDDYIETAVTIISVLTNKRNIVPVIIAVSLVVGFTVIKIIMNVKQNKKTNEVRTENV